MKFKNLISRTLELALLPINIAVTMYRKRSRRVGEAMELLNSGIYMFPKRISQSQLDELRNLAIELESIRKIPQNGQLNGRIYSEGLISERLDPFLVAPRSILDKYFGRGQYKVELSYFQRSKPEHHKDDVPGGGYHVDDNKDNFKYFIYLSDVTAECGPFTVVPSSQRWNLDRVVRSIRWSLTRARSALYYPELDSALALTEKPIAGKAGTHFLVDTTAIHRAMPIISGERLVLVISFNSGRCWI